MPLQRKKENLMKRRKKKMLEFNEHRKMTKLAKNIFVSDFIEK
jgi:hypothetical protein